MKRNTGLALLALTLCSCALSAQAVDLRYEQISQRDAIVDIRHAGDGSDRLFLIDQAGRVWARSPEQGLERVFLDIRGRVSSGGERGLLSLAFAPDYPQSGVFYTWYTNIQGDTVLSRFRVSDDPQRADENSEEILLRVDQPRANHNGGQLQFGPDGYLYLGIGDGGGANDPDDEGQNRNSLLGGLIRLDVNPVEGSYQVPADNPLVGTSGRDELWAWGLRNPWRMAFDALTGDLFIADVGQNSYEEINVQPLLDGGGQNYGWNEMEGFACLESGCNQSGLTLPVGGYGHDEGCSVTGGVVYRGQAYPELLGRYLFADFCTGGLWSLHRDGDRWVQEFLDDTSFSVLTFGTGEDGSVYLSAAGRGIYRISDGAPAEELPFSVNSGLNDAWFDPVTAGQGFFINVFPDTQQLFLSWFTFDLNPSSVPAVLGAPGQRWFTALGPIRGNGAEMVLSLTSGGVFDSSSPAPQTVSAGTLFLAFESCDSAVANYTFPELGLSGQIALRRVATDNVALCEALASEAGAQ